MKISKYYSLIFLLAAFTAACGGGETETQEQTTQEQAAQTEEATADDGVRTIELIGVDDLRFVVESDDIEGVEVGEQRGTRYVVESITASPGEEISITLNTISNLPPTAMSHNFVLLTADADTDEFSRRSLQASENDYIEPELADWVIANTEMLGNGESDTITFTVPEEPGEYDFICSFPGHYAGGMAGTLIVE